MLLRLTQALPRRFSVPTDSIYLPILGKLWREFWHVISPLIERASIWSQE